ncbi:putative ricin B-like lectin [Helianthus anomalus]
MRSVVQLTEYNPDKLDESVLWTESKDLGDGYRAVRMVNNIRLNVDAFNGDKNHGGVRDGTKIVLWEWKKDGNQRWNMVPYCKISCFVGCKCLVTSYILRYFLIVRRWSCLRVFE